ncbi:MAG: hypothetical protein ABIM19_06695, partial [candidate division WOR-3 bacterium]
YFMCGASLDDLAPGAKPSPMPFGEIRALGSYSSFGPASVVYGADFWAFRQEHDSLTLTSMPVFVQVGLLLGLPVFKPYALLELGAPHSWVSWPDTSFTSWGFGGGASLGTLLVFGKWGVDLVLGVDYMTVPARPDARDFSEGSLTGPIFRGGGGLVIAP